MQTDTPVSGQAASPLERRLDLSVPMTEIDKDVEQRLRKMSKTVKMAGFRPGKVPFKLVQQQYGGQARSEAMGAAVERVFGAAVTEQKLRVAGYPRIEPKEAANDQSFEFSAVFEVYPEITLGDLSAQSVEKPLLELTDAEVDKTIEVLRKQRTTFLPAQRAAEKGDRLVIDFNGRKDGVEFEGGKASDYGMVLGSGSMLPDFEAALEGMAAGTTKTFDVNFPADYQAANLAGQTAQFEVTVKAVEAPQLPALDSDFARVLGIPDGDLTKLRDEVRSNLKREVTKRLRARVKNQVMEALVTSTPIAVPSALVEAESRQMADAALQDFQQRGMDVRNIPIQPGWFNEQAKRRVTVGLIVGELVKSKELHAKPEQVRAVVDEFAETFEDPQEVVRWYYSQPAQLAEAEALALENNVVEWVLGQTQVTEKAVAFDELMGNGA